MAEKKTIQECCKDAMIHMTREKDKLRALLQTLKGRKELHLDKNGVDGLCYTLEDAVEAMDCMLVGQCAIAIVNAGDMNEDAVGSGDEDASDETVADAPAGYEALPGNDR